MSIIPFRADLESESESSPDRGSLEQLVTSCAARRDEIQVKLEKLKSTIKYKVLEFFLLRFHSHHVIHLDREKEIF